MKSAFELGDIVELDGSHCVVVGLSGQVLNTEQIPEEHIAVWFGELDTQQPRRIQVRTIPEEYFKKGPAPSIIH